MSSTPAILDSTERSTRIREAVLWALYGMDVSQAFWVGALDDFFAIADDQILADAEHAYEKSRTADSGVDAAQIDEHEQADALLELHRDIEFRVRGVVTNRSAIDDEIRRVSPRWRLDRMAVVDRNLLRMGIWEILERITPPIIVINECVELAKNYGERQTSAFINGLLDQVCKDHGIAIKSQKN